MAGATSCSKATTPTAKGFLTTTGSFILLFYSLQHCARVRVRASPTSERESCLNRYLHRVTWLTFGRRSVTCVAASGSLIPWTNSFVVAWQRNLHARRVASCVPGTTRIHPAPEDMQIRDLTGAWGTACLGDKHARHLRHVPSLPDDVPHFFQFNDLLPATSQGVCKP